MTPNTGAQTWARIVDGALISLARRGQQKFSMTDVGAEAGVSRGTLYRYFANREEVLEAIETRLDSSLREHVTEAIVADPGPSRRVAVTFTAVALHWDAFPALQLLVQTEPGLVLERLGRRFDEIVEFFVECLHPALVAAPVISTGQVTERGLVELMVHSAVSLCLLPSTTMEGRSALLLETVSGLLDGTAPETRHALLTG